MDQPRVIETVEDVLRSMNLARHQKHPHFHILNVIDHLDEISRKSNIVVKSIFEVTYGTYEMDISVDNSNYSVKDGHISFLSPGQSFYMDIPEEKVTNKRMAYLIFMTSDFLRMGPTDYSIIKTFPYFNRHSSPVYHVNGELEQTMRMYFEKIYNEFQILNESNIEIIRSYVTILLFEIKRSLKENMFITTKNSRAEEITFLFENLLKQTTNKRQKISFYSDKLNISSIYLAECVKKVTGDTPKKVITDYVIMEAKSLMINSGHSVEQIGFHLGFSDTSNFINFFKKNTGSTPNQFKKMFS